MTNDGDEHGDLVSAAHDAIGDLITGIPAPIRKNALKAFARLCTALVEYPVALIDNAIAEKQAESRARVKLIDTSATQIATQMQTSPEFARAAATKFANKIIRERMNLDQISEFAAAELKTAKIAGSDEPESAPIKDDWLGMFENEAATMSSEQMQQLFGKILAGEIRKPGSYSTKTVKLMAQLDNQAAALFRIFCSLSISLCVSKPSIIIDARVVPMGNPGQNSLQAFGLTFDALNILQEYGLIIPEYNTNFDYKLSVFCNKQTLLPIHFQGEQWFLLPSPPLPPERKELKVTGVGFSRSGKELFPIVEKQPNPEYAAALAKFFADQGLTMTKLFAN